MSTDRDLYAPPVSYWAEDDVWSAAWCPTGVRNAAVEANLIRRSILADNARIAIEQLDAAGVPASHIHLTSLEG